MGTYPPRECGIATFTQDLATAMNKEFSPRFKSKIIAMDNDIPKRPRYSKEVIFRIKETNIEGYIKIARKINKTKAVKLVNIQYEFGIFGGKYVNFLAAFLEILKKPVVTSLHSVVPKPSESMKSIIRYLAKKSACLVVMNKYAVNILRNDYGIKNKRIVVIHHGIHDVSYEPSRIAKNRLGYKDKIVLSSFGLISKNKSYEDIIKAMPAVVKKYPNTLYLIIGRTHPNVVEYEGEKYRNRLKKLIKKLHLNENVKFVNKYLPVPKLLEHLKATDIFVSSGKSLRQIVSGTLSYAMGCGRPVITIPFLHAKEAITKERGILVKPGNPKSFSKSIIRLLSNPKLREKMGKNAYRYTRHMVWSNVAKSYMKIFKRYF